MGNYESNYAKYIEQIFVKLEKNLNEYPYLKDKIFKSVTKMLTNSLAENDKESIEVIKKDGKKFFVKAYSTVISNKFTYNEMKEAFDLISNFCKIFDEKYLKKIICEMIELFEKDITGLMSSDNISVNSNQAKLNEPLQIDEEMNDKDGIKIPNNTQKVKTKKNNNNDPRTKKINILCLRVEIINYILKNMKASENINTLLNTFFEKYFFGENIQNANLKKKLIELFITLLDKLNDADKVLLVFHEFSNKYKGLDMINTKQKAKLFDFILENLLNKIGRDKKLGEKLNNELLQENFHIFVEIISLTKDLNRKVRNISYEMIGKLTDFMKEINLYNDWVKIILGVLASNSIYLKSAGINALSRIFWQNRSNSNLENLEIIVETFDIVLLFFKENNKEIIKSIYLFIRVLLYLLKTNFIKNSTTKILINKIIHYCFVDATKEIQKEFKVKNRNLLKTLIANFSLEEIKSACPKEIDDLVQYVNKHMVRKMKNNQNDEEEIYGKNLDYSCIMDNDEFYIDEEEEFIDKEFKKTDKKGNDTEMFLDKVNKFNIYEDDPELLKKHNLVKKDETKKVDKLEELFNKDNIELENHFYINPYANQQAKQKKSENDGNNSDDENDVVFNEKNYKLEVKDLEEDSRNNNTGMANLQNLAATTMGFQNKAGNSHNMLNKKRMKNVMRDGHDESDEEKDNRKSNKSRNDKSKPKNSKTAKNTHIVKFTGDEYKNKKGKGDNIIQGKYEPFAYIQLNPKAISKKKKKDNIEIFENLMGKK